MKFVFDSEGFRRGKYLSRRRFHGFEHAAHSCGVAMLLWRPRKEKATGRLGG